MEIFQNLIQNYTSRIDYNSVQFELNLYNFPTQQVVIWSTLCVEIFQNLIQNYTSRIDYNSVKFELILYNFSPQAIK